MLDGLPSRRRKVLHKEPQIVLYIAAIQDKRRPTIGPEARDPETKIFVWIPFRLVDLSQKLLGTFHLLEPPITRREPRLLLLQLLSSRDGDTSCPSSISPVHLRLDRSRPQIQTFTVNGRSSLIHYD